MILKEYQKLALENEILKKKLKKVEDKQLTNDLINHHKKQQKHFEGGKRKRHYENKLHIVKAVGVPKLNITYRRKKKGKKRQKIV